jgi:tRNA (guanine37-N1)-methyltransferase
MMRIDIITVLPELLSGPLDYSIVQRAREKGLVEINIHNLRDYSTDKHRKVDDYPFGGEAGMVMSVQPIERAIRKITSERDYDEIIFTTPDAPLFNQGTANRLSNLKNIIILCGHYKGVDQRVRDHLITMELSIGDYVLSGGELAAAVITDSIVRILPGAISDGSAALTDSFQDSLLSPPVYTRPADYNGWKVPEILLSGHAANIDQWRQEQAMEKTRRLRPDLLKEDL